MNLKTALCTNSCLLPFDLIWALAIRAQSQRDMKVHQKAECVRPHWTAPKQRPKRGRLTDYPIAPTCILFCIIIFSRQCVLNIFLDWIQFYSTERRPAAWCSNSTWNRWEQGQPKCIWSLGHSWFRVVEMLHCNNTYSKTLWKNDFKETGSSNLPSQWQSCEQPYFKARTQLDFPSL